MSTFLGSLLLAFIVGGVFGCGISALSKIAEGNTAPDSDAGATEGATIIHFNPDAAFPPKR